MTQNGYILLNFCHKWCNLIIIKTGDSDTEHFFDIKHLKGNNVTIIRYGTN